MINQHNSLPQHGHLNRHYYLAKYLAADGHEPTLFFGSAPHNSPLQLVPDKSKYIVDHSYPFPTVYVHTINYQYSQKKRLWAMRQFYANMLRIAQDFERPDVIIGSSSHPWNCVAALKLARRFGIPCVCEIRDLWPESIVVYGVAGKHNPAIAYLYHLEKWIYKNADRIIFTMEGGGDYILEKGLDLAHGGPVDLDKIYHINNGVDLAEFQHNLTHYSFTDPDLENPNTFKVVYAGSVRRVNNLQRLLDAAQILQQSGQTRTRILVYGDGDRRLALEEEGKRRGLSNIVFKGLVDKKYIPSLLSQADVNLLHGEGTPIMRFGASLNKMFDYFAAGVPILMDFTMAYNPVLRFGAGIETEDASPESIADGILQLQSMSPEKYGELAKNARRAAHAYDYHTLAKKLEEVLIHV